MIIVDKPKLKFLLAGRVVTAESPRGAYHRGRTYAVGVRPGKTLCRVHVLKITAIDDDRYELEIRQAAEDRARFLARNPGGQRTDYVSDPSAAAREEPEPVDAETQRKLSEQGTFRWQQERKLREVQREAAHWHERLAAVERESRRPGAADVSGELRVIRERLKKLRESA